MFAEVNSRGVFFDGVPFRILAGEMHYFRIPPSCWRDRLEKLKACGFNTVATYVPWNLHEPRPGEFIFDGMADLKAYLALADEMNLKVMLRPGPYICSEWEFGGLPAWLLAIPGMRLRCSNAPYLLAVERYFRRVLAEVKPLFCKNGGPIFAVQLENGYASYGSDANYMEALKRMVRDSGFDGILYTADGDSDTRLTSPVPQGVWRTLMIGDHLERAIAVLQKIQPDLPLMVSEFWGGQGMNNGIPLRLRDTQIIAKDLDFWLKNGGHVSVYMFHGGTTFGWKNGASAPTPNAPYHACINSYDTCAPLNEAGDPTEKYFAFRDVLKKYTPSIPTAIPSTSTKQTYGRVQLTEHAGFLAHADVLAEKLLRSESTLTMEEAGQNEGFLLYRARLPQIAFEFPLELLEVRDRAWVFVNGRHVASFHRNNGTALCRIKTSEPGAKLEILVENLGRTKFGWNLEDNRKGLTRGVVLNNQQFLHNWEILTLPLNSLAKLNYLPGAENATPCPAFFRGKLILDVTPADTFLTVTGGRRGSCWLNGFLLGRYENQGPKFSLYIPASLLKNGENHIEILEMDELYAPTVTFSNQPQ